MRPYRIVNGKPSKVRPEYGPDPDAIADATRKIREAREKAVEGLLCQGCIAVMQPAKVRVCPNCQKRLCPKCFNLRNSVCKECKQDFVEMD